MKIAAVVVVLGALAYGALAYGQAKPGGQTPGRYTIAVSKDGNVAWRLDTATGAASYCLTALKPNPINPEGTGRAESCSAWLR